MSAYFEPSPSAMTRTTQYRYSLDGLLEELVCRNGTGEQVTRWLYGVEKSGANLIARADLVREKVYPDGGADRVIYAYNQLGQPVEMTDQNGTTRAFEYDLLGRPVLDRVVDEPGPGVDGAIRAIGRTFGVDGDLEKVTSYTDEEATTVANEIEYVRDAFGQVTEERQAHSGSAGGGSPKVGYAYESAATGNSVRRTEIVYPASKQVDLRYEGTISGALGRVSKLVDATGTEADLVGYSYLGLHTLVRQVQASGLEMTAIKPSGQADGDAGDPYNGFDRFGRLEDARWIRTSNGAGRERVEFGFDRVGNKVWRRNREAASELFDESYTYDGLYQVKSLSRGKLNQNRTAIGGIPQWQEGWRYDEMGNWLGYDTAANGATVLSQERSYNAGNELLFVDGSNATVAHDPAGNMTRMPAVGAWSNGEELEAQGLVWDAWNRLVKITDGTGDPIAEYAYDGAHRRIWKKTGYPSSVVTRHFYYDDRWQILEERLDASSAAERHFVWGVRGMDDLVLRDKLNTSTGAVTQRLWALNDGKNVTAIANGHTVVERYVYNAFGYPIVCNADFDPQSEDESAYEWETRFCGYRWDGEAGLYQVRYRYYHPQLGQWVSRDPIGEKGGCNLFCHCGNSAPSRKDPSGLAVSLFSDLDISVRFVRLVGSFGTVKAGQWDVSIGLERVASGGSNEENCFLYIEGSAPRYEIQIDIERHLVQFPPELVFQVIAATFSHEKLHVSIMRNGWNAFANFANALEGHWCPCECAELAREAIDFKQAVELAYIVMNNSLFDLDEYGVDVGGATRRELESRAEDARRAALAANAQLTDKIEELSNCIRKSKQ